MTILTLAYVETREDGDYTCEVSSADKIVIYSQIHENTPLENISEYSLSDSDAEFNARGFLFSAMKGDPGFSVRDLL